MGCLLTVGGGEGSSNAHGLIRIFEIKLRPTLSYNAQSDRSPAQQHDRVVEVTTRSDPNDLSLSLSSDRSAMRYAMCLQPVPPQLKTPSQAKETKKDQCQRTSSTSQQDTSASTGGASPSGVKWVAGQRLLLPQVFQRIRSVS